MEFQLESLKFQGSAVQSVLKIIEGTEKTHLIMLF